jgi:hypothetical protein
VRRDLTEILSGAEKGQKVLRSQRYEITNVVASGQHVAIEMSWRGELAVPLGTKSPGDAITGKFAFFLDIEDGRIRSMRNYDCYDPF